MSRKLKPTTALGKAVDYYQSEAGLSMYKISHLTSLDEGTLSKLKSGKTSPTIDTLERVANVLEVPLSTIILKKEEFENEE